MSSPLYVSLVWHMHQPFYKDTRTGEYTLPWVRLHAIKDYVHVARVISDFPSVHQTINVVPSLAEQLQDYATGVAVDRLLDVSRRAAQPGAVLGESDRAVLLEQFFSINWDRFIWPNPRYAELARLREAANHDTGLFNDQYWRDLVAWFNLSWIDPSIRERNPRLKQLVDQGRDYRSEDIATILAEQQSLCAEVLPLYRRLAESGQVELAVSPYYHPILPLLVDTVAARDASPQLPLPQLRFAVPGDARIQIADAIAYHRQTFGVEPNGMWPPEGAISQAAIELIGLFPTIQWIASDEHVLARSLGQWFERDSYGHLRDPRPVCQPYRPRGRGPMIFFRDQVLSDRVGFVYQHWDSRAAADDLVERLLHIGRTLGDSDHRSEPPPIVSIILDGENCWESYQNNGDDFLRHLFERLTREPSLSAVTPGEYLRLNPDVPTRAHRLGKVPAASWIGSNLETWIGEPDQNRAWEYLALARTRLALWERENNGSESQKRSRAWHALHVAEGSDWFWWYYSRNRVGGEETFDVQFRQELANVYRAIDAEIPDWLNRPLAGQLPPRYRDVAGPVTIHRLTGEREAEAGWNNAGYADPATSSGSMQVGSRVFRRFYFGYDETSLFFRLDLAATVPMSDLSIYVTGQSDDLQRLTWDGVAGESNGDRFLEVGNEFTWRIDLPGASGDRLQLYRADPYGGWTTVASVGEAAVGEVACEIRIDRSDLNLSAGQLVYVAAGLRRDGSVVDVVPTSGAAGFRLGEVTVTGDAGSTLTGDPHGQPQAYP